MADAPPPVTGTPRQPHSAPSEPVSTSPRPHPTGRTRISATWVAVIVATLVLVMLLVFILQNTESVEVSYFTAEGTMPLGVALLLAAVGGVLLAGLVASLRIWQLRHRLRNPEP
jgi:uncharacterized integral membrane protein